MTTMHEVFYLDEGRTLRKGYTGAEHYVSRRPWDNVTIFHNSDIVHVPKYETTFVRFLSEEFLAVERNLLEAITAQENNIDSINKEMQYAKKKLKSLKTILKAYQEGVQDDSKRVDL